MDLACLDGLVVPLAEARIPVTDEGLLRGDGAFEVVRLYGGEPHALDEHLERMTRSTANLRLAFDAVAFEEDARALLAAARPGDGLLRLVATRGGHRIALLEPLPKHGPSIALGYVAYTPTRVLDGIKSLSYGANMLTDRLARERGFDAALLVTPHGRVLEGSTSSFFLAIDGELRVPPLSDHVLDSIIRRKVMAAVAVVEAPITVEDVARATGGVLASTTREAQPVSRAEDVQLDVADPLVAEAAERTHALIAAELAGLAQT